MIKKEFTIKNLGQLTELHGSWSGPYSQGEYHRRIILINHDPNIFEEEIITANLNDDLALLNINIGDKVLVELETYEYRDQNDVIHKDTDVVSIKKLIDYEKINNLW